MQQLQFKETVLSPLVKRINERVYDKFVRSQLNDSFIYFHKEQLKKKNKKFRERNWNKAFKMCPCRVPLITFKKMPIVPDWVSLLGVIAT